MMDFGDDFDGYDDGDDNYAGGAAARAIDVLAARCGLVQRADIILVPLPAYNPSVCLQLTKACRQRVQGGRALVAILGNLPCTS